MSRYEHVPYVWKFLAPLPAFWRLHQVGRSLLSPFMALIEQLPASPPGHPLTVLDLGCGHGVFLAMAKRKRPDIEVIGLDLSEDKIAGARQVFAASDYTVRELAVKDIAAFDKQAVDVITILDVLYLVPLEQWEGILRQCHDCLKPGGKLLLKEMDRSITWKFRLLYLEETLAVKILGLTLGSKFTFPSAQYVRSLMASVGFSVREVPMDRGYFVPHLLWIGSKE
jgi:cyclopropane fatty-acyl-phospholipid synthase-like methyltransferase